MRCERQCSHGSNRDREVERDGNMGISLLVKLLVDLSELRVIFSEH